MNKDELKGKAQNLAGRAKEAAGSLLGDKRKQAEGFVDRVRGAVREKLGKAKDEAEAETRGEGDSQSEGETIREASREREEDDDE